MMDDTSTMRLRIQDDMKSAMRAHDSVRLTTIRFLLSKIKQREIDEQITLDDTQILAVIEKLIKQHKDAINQFKNAKRDDLADKEHAELLILQAYMPEPLTDEAIDALIKKAIKETNASSIRDMGKVMGIVKTKIQGRADISTVSLKIKALLSI